MSSQEQPQDRPPEDPPEAAESGATEDAAAGTNADDEAEADDVPPTEDERLEQLTERIDKARDRAEEAGVLVDTDEGTYADSGATEEEDDQTITPPG